MAPIIVPSRLREPYKYLPPASASTSSQKVPFEIQSGNSNNSSSSKSKSATSGGGGGGRRIGSDEKPLETEYYDFLGVPINATTSEIKSAYRRMALKMHPDKNPDDKEAEEKFKKLAVAYNTLSDPQLRKKYNEFGKQQDGEQGFVDPEVIFSTLFGGEKFQDIIGTISLGQEMKSALQKESEDDEDEPGNQLVPTSQPLPPEVNPKKTLTAEQRAKKQAAADAEALERKKTRDARVSHLSEKLKNRLCLYTEQAETEFDQPVMDSVKMIWTIEKDSLCDESFGPELLRTVGSTYVAKARRCLTATANGAWGGVALVGGWFHSAKSTAHVFSETVGAVRAAYDVKAVFDEIAKAEAEGGVGITEERKKELEEEAARKGLRALFKGAKLEVESVIREVCDKILEEPGIPRDKIRKRAVALEILGSVYETAQNKAGDDLLAELETGYVKVDQKKKTTATSPSQPKPS
ncbi:DNAJ protein Caj1/Djp1-type [Phakopsora pachyrhizi]|nr:DNAJ protein Caj1/Djp1-type [Phakopsora pachyrhizi]